MKLGYKIFAICLASSPVYADTLSSTFSSRDVTVSDGNISVSGSSFTTALTYDMRLANRLAILAGFAYTTGDLEGIAVSGTSFAAGVGYAFSDNLNRELGTGSEFIVGAMFENTRAELGDFNSTESNTALAATFTAAMSPAMTINLAVSSPTDELVSSLTYSAGIGFDVLGSELELGISGLNSNVDGITSDGTGFYIGWNSNF